MSDRIIDIEPDDLERPGRSHRRFGIGCSGLLSILFVLFIGSKTIASWIIDYAWWEEVGQLPAWWSQLYFHTAPIFYATVFATIVLWVVHLQALRSIGIRVAHHPGYLRLAAIATLVVAWVLAAAQFSSWEIASWIGSRGIAPSAWRDPIFAKPLEFYFFDLPMYRSTALFLFALLALSTLVYVAVSRAWALRGRFGGGPIVLEWEDIRGRGFGAAQYLAAAALLAFAAAEWFGIYEQLYEDHPFLTGADYVSVYWRIPLGKAWVVAIAGAAIAVAAGRAKLALLALVVVPIRAFLPAAVNSIHVRPNEITMQKPYIENHMQATRNAYGLAGRMKEMEVRANSSGRFDVARNQALLDNVRLWDWQAFHDTVSQIQPLRPYTYVDTDVDRYILGGKLRQVLLSPRELEIQQLGEARNRWPNRHVVYTHGYGVVAADANRITPDGLPKLFIHDAPPKVTAEGLKLTRPEIYFGEVEHEPVFVHTSQPEFNYPSGSQNVHNTYDGTGGFRVGSFGMRVAAAVAYSDWNILLTSYLQSESRMMIRRKVKSRLETLTPFLTWDEDPYLVLDPEGRLIWMADGFSTSDRHPYSAPVRTTEAGRLNYVRNSVKATVDAYSGETRIYVFEPSDPLIQAYRNLFPSLLLDKSSMPPALREHARYPEWLFRIQAEVLLTFHMDVADAFYNKVDVWDLARRSTGGGAGVEKAVVEPSYQMAVLPKEAGGKGEPEFLLMLPFTPRNKDNLIGMLIARCDGEALGEIVLMELPKEELFYGPMQIQSRIRQDQNIAKDLTLWNQQGSQVLDGQMVILPVDDTFLFVQPIYLQARQARMPQLNKVILAFGNDLIYTNTYEQALAELAAVQGGKPAPPAATLTDTPEGTTPPATPRSPTDPRIDTLRTQMERYRKAAQQGQWAEAGKALEAMESELRRKP